jgi:hypothetical protein
LHPEAFVTDESILGDVPLREEPSTPTVTELTSALGIRVEPQHRLVDIARRMRQLADRQITAGTPEARHAHTTSQLTLLGKARRSLSSAMGVRITRGINLAGFFKRHVFELEGR